MCFSLVSVLAGTQKIAGPADSICELKDSQNSDQAIDYAVSIKNTQVITGIIKDDYLEMQFLTSRVRISDVRFTVLCRSFDNPLCI